MVIPDGFKLVPIVPTEDQWGGLARDIVMWTRMAGNEYPYRSHTGAALHRHLCHLGVEVPEWLAKEIPDNDRVPPKGTVAAVIYRAMLEDYVDTRSNA